MSLILIIILFVVFAIISYKKTSWGLYLICFFLPSYLIRFKIGFMPFTFLEGMILILFLVWIVKEIINKNLLNIVKNFPKNKFFIPIILFILAPTISILISPVLESALGIWKAYFIEPLLLFAVFINTIYTKKKINKIFWSLGLSALIIAIIAIIQYITGLWIPESYDLPNIKRATAVYGYPGAVGLFIAPILTLFIGLFIKELGIKNRGLRRNNKMFLYLLVIFSLIIAIILAKTEGAIIAVLVATFFMLMFTRLRKYIIFGSLVLLLMLFILPISRDYIVTLVTFKDASGDVRIALWEGTLRLIKNHPIFGAGLAGFPELYGEYKEAKHVEFLQYPHNIFLNFWVETGVLGLISFLLIIVVFFKEYFLKFFKQNFQLVLMGIMVCILVYGLVDVPYFKNDLSCLFWIWIGLSVAVSKLKPKEST